jgi:hypothetical protein
MLQRDDPMSNASTRNQLLKATPAELHLLTSAEIEPLLIALLEQYDQSSYVDFDRLMSVGLRLARSGHDAADAAAVAWLALQPSARRLDIVAALLCGLWHRGYRSRPVSGAVVDQLIAARPGVGAVGDDAEYSYIQALCQVLESAADSATKAQVRQEVQRVGQRAFVPALRDTVQARIKQALAVPEQP